MTESEDTFLNESKDAARAMSKMLVGKSMAHCIATVNFLIAMLGSGFNKKNSFEFLNEIAETVNKYKEIMEAEND